MPWSAKTLREIHGALMVTAIAAILEMSGGADRTNISIITAIYFFAISLPINLYAWICLNENLLANRDDAAMIARTPMGLVLLGSGTASVFCGLNFVIAYFSGFATIALGLVTAFFVHYDRGIRWPRYKALLIWREHQTREGRLAAWKAATGQPAETFDRNIDRWRKRGYVPKEPEESSDVEAES
jgi:hypothetical protein